MTNNSVPKPQPLLKDLSAPESVWGFWKHLSHKYHSYAYWRKNIDLLDSWGMENAFTDQEGYYVWYSTMVRIGMMLQEFPNWRTMVPKLDAKTYVENKELAIQKPIELLNAVVEDVPRTLLCLVPHIGARDWDARVQQVLTDTVDQIEQLKRWSVSEHERGCLLKAMELVQLFVDGTLTQKDALIVSSQLRLPVGRLHAVCALTGSIDVGAARVVSEGFKRLHQCSAKEVVELLDTMVVFVSATGSREVQKQTKACERIKKSIQRLENTLGASAALCVLQAGVQVRATEALSWSMLDEPLRTGSAQDIAPWQMQRVSAKSIEQLQAQYESYEQVSVQLLEGWKRLAMSRKMWLQVDEQGAPIKSSVHCASAFASSVGHSVFVERFLRAQVQQKHYDAWERQWVMQRPFGTTSALTQSVVHVLEDAKSAVGVLFAPVKTYEKVKLAREQAQAVYVAKGYQKIFDTYVPQLMPEQLGVWMGNGRYNFHLPEGALTMSLAAVPFESAPWCHWLPQEQCSTKGENSALDGAGSHIEVQTLQQQLQRLEQSAQGSAWIEYVKNVKKHQWNTATAQLRFGALCELTEGKKGLQQLWWVRLYGGFESIRLDNWIALDPKVLEAWKTATAHHEHKSAWVQKQLMLRVGLQVLDGSNTLERWWYKPNASLHAGPMVAHRALKKSQFKSVFDQYWLEQCLAAATEVQPKEEGKSSDRFKAAL